MIAGACAGKELAHISDLTYDDEDRSKVLSVLWQRLEDCSPKNFWRIKKTVCYISSFLPVVL